MTTSSRFAICIVGNGFSVENRRTGERIGYFHTWGAATAFATKLSVNLSILLAALVVEKTDVPSSLDNWK